MDEQLVFDDYTQFDKERTEFETRNTAKVFNAMAVDGVSLLLCSHEIDAFCSKQLAEIGIEAIKHVERSDLLQISAMTGAPSMMFQLASYKSTCIGCDCEVSNQRICEKDFINIKSKKM